MIILVQASEAIVEEIAAPVGLMDKYIDTIDFYGVRPMEDVQREVEEYQYQLHLEELERQRQAEEEAERLRLEEEARQRAIQEELERQRKPHFNAYDVRERSNVTESQMANLLSNTGLSDVSWVFTFAEDTFGVNALFLLGITALESGWGTSHRAVNHNNLTGYNIVSDSSVYTFPSRADSVLATAKLLAKDYLDENGRYYNGFSVQSVNEKYCANNDWSDKVIAISTKMRNNLLE